MDGALSLSVLAMEPETKLLARGLRQRDPDLLEALISRYEYRLYRYLLYLTGSAEAASDLFQETWLRVLTRGHQYDGVSRFEPWLLTAPSMGSCFSPGRAHASSRWKSASQDANSRQNQFLLAD